MYRCEDLIKSVCLWISTGAQIISYLPHEEEEDEYVAVWEEREGGEVIEGAR